MTKFQVRCLNDCEYIEVNQKGELCISPNPSKGKMLGLTKDKIYEVIAVEGDMYRIVDDTDEDYLYPKGMFEKVD